MDRGKRHKNLNRRSGILVGFQPTLRTCGVNGLFNALEDFAESLTAFVYPARAMEKSSEGDWSYSKYGYSSYLETPRGNFIEALLISYQ